jgi:hypothetical protein
MKNVAKAFKRARALLAETHPEVLAFGLWVGCPICEKAHREAYRNFMHVGHHPATVCSSAAAKGLGKANLLGLFLHEFGHVIGGPSQWEADQAILWTLGIPIRYDRRGIQFVEER